MGAMVFGMVVGAVAGVGMLLLVVDVILTGMRWVLGR